jgi:hypothetical protein
MMRVSPSPDTPQLISIEGCAYKWVSARAKFWMEKCLALISG